MSERVFITGTSGMLGANLCRRLVENGMDVTALVRRPLHHPLLKGFPIRQVVGDLSEVAALREAMRGCDIVFHTAGVVSYQDRDRAKLYATNLHGSRNIIRAATLASVRRVVHTSSTAAIGIPEKNEEPLHEQSHFNPRFRNVHYMASKRAAEEEALTSTDIEVVAVNPATIYGAGDVYMNTGMLFRQIKRRAPKWVPPGGTAVVSVRDCVEGHLLALKLGKPGHRYILASGNYSLLELWSGIARAVGVEPPKRTLPRVLCPIVYSAGYVHDKILPQALRSPLFTRHLITIAFGNRYFDASLAKRELGWTPRQSLEEMLEEATKFYTEHGLL